MRVFLAILALVGLLLSPVAASAAVQRCLHQDGGAMIMDMSATPASADSQASPHNCCDEHGKPVKHDSKACAQACATMCGVAAALPSEPMSLPLRLSTSARPDPRTASLHPHEPSRLERPPKSIA